MRTIEQFLRSAGVPLLFAIVTACSDSSGPSTLNEDFGTPITDSGEVDPEMSRIAWSPDGAEVFYYSGGGSSGLTVLKAVRVAQGTVRLVDSTPRFDRFGLEISPDGHDVYYGSGGDLERTPAVGGQSQNLTPSVLVPARAPVRPAMAFGNGDSILAFAVTAQCSPISSCDSMFLYDVRTNQRTYLHLGEPLAFSPGDTALLYVDRPCDEYGPQTTCQLQTITLSTGTSHMVGVGEMAGGGGELYYSYFWSQQALRRLTYLNDTLVLEDLRSGTKTNVALPRGIAVLPSLISWTAGGQSFAEWVFSPRDGADRLYIVDLATGQLAVAALTLSAPPGAVCFSPDGRQVAYVLGTRIYVRTIS